MNTCRIFVYLLTSRIKLRGDLETHTGHLCSDSVLNRRERDKRTDLNIQILLIIRRRTLVEY